MSKPIVAIVGRPNVGKSTLFNALAGERISIVQDFPGVTRDRIYAEINWLNYQFTMIDTGGIEPESKDMMLTYMRQQAQTAIDTADIILFVVDVKQGLVDADFKVADMLRRAAKPVVLCVNKVDDFNKYMADIYEFYNLGIGEPYPISATNALGIGDVLDKIYEETIANNETQQKNLNPTVKLPALSLKDKIDFSTTYQTLAGAGVPVVESLLFMEQEANSVRIRRLSKELRKHILAGSTFADTVKRYSNVFGQIFVGLTKAGEDAGEMETTMGRIIELLRKQEAVKNKVLGAMMYPAFVVVLALIVVIVMLTFVFPKFAAVFADRGKVLPPITQFCIDSGNFLQQYCGSGLSDNCRAADGSSTGRASHNGSHGVFST